MTKKEKEELYKKAQEKVKDLKGFYIHVSIYFLVNAFLFLVDIFTGKDWWFYWVVLGWGVGLLAHWISIKGENILGTEWEEQKIKEIMMKEENKT